MDAEKRQKLEELVENNKFFKKWEVGKVTLEHVSQNKVPLKFLEQHRKAYPKIAEMVNSYLKDEALLSQVTNSGHAERITTQTIKYKNYSGAMEVDVETDSIYGRVLYIQDVVTFKADTVRQAKIEFAKSVEDYLEFCQELNKEPN